MTAGLCRSSGIRMSSLRAFTLETKRQFSTEKPLVITDSFITKYDQFKKLPLPEKIHRLTSRTLDLLLQTSNYQGNVEDRWKKLQAQYLKDGRELDDYTPNSELNLRNLLLIDARISSMSKEIRGSITTEHWSKETVLQYPLEGKPTIEQEFIGRLLPKFVTNKTALIGAATFGGNETFYFLRSLAVHAKARSFIRYVANIEVNELNSRLADVVAQELDLNPRLFRSVEGNALNGLPFIPSEIETAQQAIICTRFLPILTHEEMFDLTRRIRESLNRMPGYAILTYSTLSIRDWEKPESVILRYYLTEVKESKLKVLEIRAQNKELLGVSFIELIGGKGRGFTKGATHQTFLFRERISQFFSQHELVLIDQIHIGAEGLMPREAAVLTTKE